MESGRELDALVADKVMGLSVRQVVGYAEYIKGRDVAYTGEWIYDTDEPYDLAIEVPYYSTDIAASWEVVEKMRPSYRFNLFEYSCYEAQFRKLGDQYIAVGRAQAVPHAICLAALRACGVKVSTE
jgi:hypothetical protein